jgi:ABC-2 type transport system ATP-binding protein
VTPRQVRKRPDDASSSSPSGDPARPDPSLAASSAADPGSRKDAAAPENGEAAKSRNAEGSDPHEPQSPKGASPKDAASRPEPAVRLRELVKTFGTATALQGVTADMAPGRITGLVGPDAAGKTTLLRILTGLLEPTSGSVTVFGGAPAAVLQESPNSIGYMPQRFGLYEDLSVMANMRLHAHLRALSPEQEQERFEELLRFTRLAPFTDRLAGRLSGGMKQKLGIACALLGSPKLLLLDEPSVGVDPLSRRDLWAMVQDLGAEGMTVVWSTSYMDEAAKCPDVILLDAGRILHAGPPEDMTRRIRGRVFLVPAPAATRKAELIRLGGTAGIEDALIQGERLRVVLAEDAPAPLREEILAAGATPATPCLEDAYMSAVGGMTKTPSPFAGKAPTTTGTAPRIVARSLTKRFGTFTAANEITFSVLPGEIFGLLGPNGAGKSTTFRMCCGLLRPTAGDCTVDGVNLLTAGSEARSRLGYMAQKFSLYPDIPVQSNISIFADLYGLDKAESKRIAAEMTEALELGPFLQEPTGRLPLGQKQRLALVCATLHRPRALFLDEPTSGVDVRTRRDFWKHITAMTATGTSVLVTTHFMEEAEYCDRIALVYRGNIISLGTPSELKASCVAVPDPTMEDAFLECVERHDREHPE